MPKEGTPSDAEQKSIHKLIKKVSQDIENFSYNTSISAFMICVSELSQLKCTNKEVLNKLVVLIAPFAPHIAEELWEALNRPFSKIAEYNMDDTTSVCDAQWPECDEKFLVESTMKLTVSFNGKARFTIDFPADADNATIEKTVLADEKSAKYMEGKSLLKVIIVPKRIVNVVLK